MLRNTFKGPVLISFDWYDKKFQSGFHIFIKTECLQPKWNAVSFGVGKERIKSLIDQEFEEVLEGFALL